MENRILVIYLAFVFFGSLAILLPSYAFSSDLALSSNTSQSASNYWTSLGGQSERIAVGNNKDGSLVLFSIGKDGILYYNNQNTVSQGIITPNTDWTNILGAYLKKELSVVNYKDSRLVLFSIGNDGVPYYTFQLKPGGEWNTEWTGLSGQSKQIAVGNYKDSRLVLFSIGNDGVPYYKFQLTPGGRWSFNWTSLGGESKQIAVGNNKEGSLLLFSIGNDSNVYWHEPEPGNSSSRNSDLVQDWKSLGGQSKFLTTENDKLGNLVLFSIGMDDTPYYKQQFNNGTWSPDWTSLGGQSKQIAVGNAKDGSPALISIGIDGIIYYYLQ